MIQRIQTVYLALVVVLNILGLCLPIGQYYNGAEMVAQFNNFVYSPTKLLAEQSANALPLALGITLILVVLLSLASIMLFRYRMRQLRLTIFSTILLVGYIAYYAFVAFGIYSNVTDVFADAKYHLAIAGIFPVISVILNCLAIHGIRKDEALVRSLDRLR